MTAVEAFDTPIINTLIAIASQSGFSDPASVIVPRVSEPQWNESSSVHDWRNYITESMREVWDRLSMESRLVAYSFASSLAFDEEWD